MSNTTEHHVLWHQLDDDGNVEAVFASAKEELYSEMLKHAKYVASLANEKVRTDIIEGENGIVVRFAADHVDPQGVVATVGEFTALVIGKPDQPFDKIHFTNLEDEHGRMAAVAMTGDSWKNASDIIEAEFETTDEES